MSKILVVPDVHLKPWMFDKADEIIARGTVDRTVLLGDLVDDWDHEKDLDLYKETLERALRFVQDHPDTLYCFGNHDMSYMWEALESGYSPAARDIAVEGINEIIHALPPENSGYIHRIDDVLFCHAGLSEPFVIRRFGYGGMIGIDEMISMINRMGRDELWRDDSPLWARPQHSGLRMYPSYMLQVVGHTPVEAPLREKNVLTLDTFSTYRDGSPIGDQRFVCVDTVSMEHEYV
ncbi:MAG: metallophosphoesterase [Oscillospiraceae bacterium]|nr:metallophosphoesterase [Oscillospiraceae bacterium]